MRPNTPVTKARHWAACIACVAAIAAGCGADAAADCDGKDADALMDNPTTKRPNKHKCLGRAAGYMFLDMVNYAVNEYAVGICRDASGTSNLMTRASCLGTCGRAPSTKQDRCAVGTCRDTAGITSTAYTNEQECLEGAGECSDGNTNTTATTCLATADKHWVSYNTWDFNTTTWTVPLVDTVCTEKQIADNACDNSYSANKTNSTISWEMCGANSEDCKRLLTTGEDLIKPVLGDIGEEDSDIPTNIATPYCKFKSKPNEDENDRYLLNKVQCPATLDFTTTIFDNFLSDKTAFKKDVSREKLVSSEKDCWCENSENKRLVFKSAQPAALACMRNSFTWTCSSETKSADGAATKDALEAMLCEHGRDMGPSDLSDLMELVTDEADKNEEVSLSDFSIALNHRPMHVPWFLFLILCEAFLFWGIAIVCDDFFTPSLEQLSIKFELSEDVAGATFMAAGSSAPELFTSLASVIIPAPCSNRSSVGIGTIVGSAIFNILIIIGATAMLTTEILQLSWRPLVRDTCWYGLSILLLVLFVVADTEKDEDTLKTTGTVTWWEGLIMTSVYFAYIIFMKFSERIMGTGASTVKDEPVEVRIRRNSVVDGTDEPKADEPSADVDPEGCGETTATLTKDENGDDEDEDEEEGETDCCGVEKPEGFLSTCSVYFAYPWYLAFMATVPECENSTGARMYIAFANSIIWIGIICWFMVEGAIILGEMAGVSATVMGLTVLSAGTSVPDAISSIVVAQRGLGYMAVSNALGSNVFDILLGLGFPYFLAAVTQGEPVRMCTDDVTLYIICLAAVLFIVIGTFAAFKFQLHPKLGYLLITTYVLFATFAILRDTKVILEDQPSCAAGH